MKIGRITKEQQRKNQAKIRREENLDNGFKSTHSVHPSKKTYTRKTKHKKK
jgi:hypothetical protein